MVWERHIGTAVGTHGLRYDAGIRSRFGNFERQTQRYPGRDSAEFGLEAEFGGTYMYYYAFIEPLQHGAVGPYWVLLANALMARGETDAAVGYYRQALRKDPESVEAHICLGNALMARGEAEEAATHYRQALSSEPDSGEARQQDRTWQLRSH